MAKVKKDFWNLDMRKDLQNLLREGYNIKQVERIWKESLDYCPSDQSIAKEIKAGLSKEDYKNKLYVKYDIGLVYKNKLGDDVIEFIKAL